MKTAAKLIDVRVPKDPEAVVLVLHGGGSRVQGMAVSPTQLSVLRMVPIARRAARAGRGRLAVFRLLNSVRGWDDSHTPVADVEWAIGELGDRVDPALSVGLVGHSLGGRAALLAAAQPRVASAVALAPWVYPGDGRVDAEDVRVLVVHGSADRIASPERSAAAAAALRRRARSLSYVTVTGGKHAMLARHDVFSSLAAGFTAAALLDPPPRTSELVSELVRGGVDRAL